jgi:hypothetical protein
MRQKRVRLNLLTIVNHGYGQALKRSADKGSKYMFRVAVDHRTDTKASFGNRRDLFHLDISIEQAPLEISTLNYFFDERIANKFDPTAIRIKNIQAPTRFCQESRRQAAANEGVKPLEVLADAPSGFEDEIILTIAAIEIVDVRAPFVVHPRITLGVKVFVLVCEGKEMGICTQVAQVTHQCKVIVIHIADKRNRHYCLQIDRGACRTEVRSF